MRGNKGITASVNQMLEDDSCSLSGRIEGLLSTSKFEQTYFR